MTDLRDLRTLRQFAEAFPGFTRRYLYYLIRSNAAFNAQAVVRIGKKIFLDAAAVQQWVEQHRPRVPGWVKGWNDGRQHLECRDDGGAWYVVGTGEESGGRTVDLAGPVDTSQLVPVAGSWRAWVTKLRCHNCARPLQSLFDQCPDCQTPSREE